MRSVGVVARLAAASELATDQREDILITLVVAAALAIAALGAATVLSIFKPWGMTAIGLREHPAAGRTLSAEVERAS